MCMYVCKYAYANVFIYLYICAHTHLYTYSTFVFMWHLRTAKMTIRFFCRRNRFKIRQLREVRKSEKMAEETETHRVVGALIIPL